MRCLFRRLFALKDFEARNWGVQDIRVCPSREFFTLLCVCYGCITRASPPSGFRFILASRGAAAGGQGQKGELDVSPVPSLLSWGLAVAEPGSQLTVLPQSNPSLSPHPLTLRGANESTLPCWSALSLPAPL